MASKQFITEKTFATIKKLTAAGMTIPEISDIVGVSSSSVSRVRAVKTFAEFKGIQRKPAAKPEPKPEPKPSAQPQNPTVIKLEASHYLMVETQKTNQLLTLISAKLAYIVDELCGTAPQRKEE